MFCVVEACLVKWRGCIWWSGGGIFSEVEGVHLMEGRGHVLCSGGMFSEVEGVYLVWWRGYRIAPNFRGTIFS